MATKQPPDAILLSPGMLPQTMRPIFSHSLASRDTNNTHVGVIAGGVAASSVILIVGLAVAAAIRISRRRHRVTQSTGGSMDALSDTAGTSKGGLPVGLYEMRAHAAEVLVPYDPDNPATFPGAVRTVTPSRSTRYNGLPEV